MVGVAQKPNKWPIGCSGSTSLLLSAALDDPGASDPQGFYQDESEQLFQAARH
jgi:hypothetical protein